MMERLPIIEEKLDSVTRMISELTELVKTMTPAEAKKYSEQLKKQFEATEEKMRLTMKLVRSVTGNTAPQATYTVNEAAHRLGLAAFTIRQNCNKGFIRASKVSGAGTKGEWRISEIELQRFEREGNLDPPEPPRD
jgi:hypothetical protein